MSVTTTQWDLLTSYSNEFTCYSAAVATWAAIGERDWKRLVDPGLWIRITEEDDGLLGFAYFPPTLRSELGLIRAGADEPGEALAGVLGELERSGRVIVAGDGFRLPWHVAHERVHAPHWFVLARGENGLDVADPFACRNELGVQEAARRDIDEHSLPELLRALPGDDGVHHLREVLSLGDRAPEHTDRRYQWFAAGDVQETIAPHGADGPDAALRLARHFRERGGEPQAYVQADDIWSIARHRAFMYRHTLERAQDDPELEAWASEHAAALAKRWGHIAPLLMQATLSIRAGRAPSSSVPDMLERIAGLEREAAVARGEKSSTI